MSHAPIHASDDLASFVHESGLRSKVHFGVFNNSKQRFLGLSN